MNITYVEKDKLLKVLCENVEPERLMNASTKQMMLLSELSLSELQALFSYFNRIGITKGAIATRNSISLILLTEAFDLFNRGGFTAREHLFEQEVKKLALELEKLTPTLGDRATKLTAIVANLATIAGIGIASVQK